MYYQWRADITKINVIEGHKTWLTLRRYILKPVNNCIWIHDSYEHHKFDCLLNGLFGLWSNKTKRPVSHALSARNPSVVSLTKGQWHRKRFYIMTSSGRTGNNINTTPVVLWPVPSLENPMIQPNPVMTYISGPCRILGQNCFNLLWFNNTRLH